MRSKESKSKIFPFKYRLKKVNSPRISYACSEYFPSFKVLIQGEQENEMLERKAYLKTFNFKTNKISNLQIYKNNN